MTPLQLRRGALAGLLALVPALAGCHFPIFSQQLAYQSSAGETVPTAPPPPAKAAKKNDIVVGVRRFDVTARTAAAIAESNDSRELGIPDELSRRFADALLAAKIFKEVHYPLEDQAVDVVIEGTLDLAFDPHHGANAAKAVPGTFILMPWLDAFGFAYDHRTELELRVRDAQHPEVVCDAFGAKSSLTVRRYPPVFIVLAGPYFLILLPVTEGVTTDIAVANWLVERNAAEAHREAIAWLLKEFEPAARACPKHPDAKITGKFCPICGASLRYPILNRVKERRAAESPIVPVSATATPGAPAAATPTAQPK